MPTVHEISTIHKVPVKYLRILQRKGFLRNVEPDEESPGARLKHQLLRNRQLTVAQMVAFIESPELVGQMGGYADRIGKEIRQLGNVQGEAAPRGVAAAIEPASRGDPDAVEAIGTWLRSILPAHDVGHHWVAVRLLIGQAPAFREADSRRLVLALVNVRHLPAMAGWSTKLGTGGKRDAQTVYHQFREHALDL